MRTRSLIVVLLLLLIPGVLFAGTTGKLKGKVVDKTTGEPLVGVNVIIMNTTLGAATDEKGEFFIINIPPSTYTVQISYIGFRVQKVEEVRIIADYTTEMDVELTPEALATEEIVVTAEKEIIKRDLTATATFHSKEEIINMPVNSFTEVMNTAAGFIQSNNTGDADQDGIHLRGGRAGEVGFYVDGFYMEDVLYGGSGGDVARLGIQDLSILTGTFNAEYGQAMSGIVNIVTPEGGPTYSGQIRAGTDQMIEHFDWGGSRIEGSLSGPVPMLGNKLRFFVTADHSETDTYLHESSWRSPEGIEGSPPTVYTLPFDTYNFVTRFTEKLTFTPVENTKISIGGNHSRNKFKNFSYGYLAYPQGAAHERRNSDMINFTWTQTISKSTFFNVKTSWFQHRYNTGLYDDWDPTKVSDLALITNNVNPLFVGDLAEMYPAFANSNYEFLGPYLNEIGEYNYPNSTYWQKYENTEMNVLFDLTSQVHSEHLIKIGGEYRTFEINNNWISGINSYAAWDQDTGEYASSPDDFIHYEVTKYTFKPKQAAFYVQDKMEFENMIVNLGLRLDYLDVAAKGLSDPYELTDPANAQYNDVDPQTKVSPRIGFGYPITDQAVLHFAYGRFIQFPDFRYLYRRWNEDRPYPNLNEGYEPSLGNPSLEPEKTTQYEIGANWMLSQDLAVDVTLYYKDIYDFVSTQRINISPAAYTAIVNLDYGNSKGIEVSVNKRFSNHWAFRSTYTFSRSEGNADDWETHADELYTASVTGLVPPKTTNILAWDQPHTINFVLDYRYPDNWGVNIVGYFGSGLPYTPTDARGRYTGKKNSGRMPWTGNIDLRINKDFRIRNLRYQIWADINNLFNKRNIFNVFNNSGRPDYSTNPNASPIFQYRPQWYSPPRHIELGMSLIF